jgi:phosphoribosyl-dephospho-CoA transferase
LKIEKRKKTKNIILYFNHEKILNELLINKNQRKLLLVFSLKNNYSVGDILCFTFNLKQKIHRCLPTTLKLTSVFEIRLEEILVANMI